MPRQAHIRGGVHDPKEDKSRADIAKSHRKKLLADGVHPCAESNASRTRPSRNRPANKKGPGHAAPRNVGNGPSCEKSRLKAAAPDHTKLRSGNRLPMLTEPRVEADALDLATPGAAKASPRQASCRSEANVPVMNVPNSSTGRSARSTLGTEKAGSRHPDRRMKSKDPECKKSEAGGNGSVRAPAIARAVVPGLLDPRSIIDRPTCCQIPYPWPHRPTRR